MTPRMQQSLGRTSASPTATKPNACQRRSRIIDRAEVRVPSKCLLQSEPHLDFPSAGTAPNASGSISAPPIRPRALLSFDARMTLIQKPRAPLGSLTAIV